MKLAVVLSLCVAAALPTQGAARFAVIAGNNRGAAGRAQLWYAERDAERFAHALEELGDFTQSDVQLLRGASVTELRAAITAAEAQVKKARARGERALLIVYFSGHAGSGGLELADDHLGYDELRADLATSSAETKVAIVDACEAGTLTQVKGARPSASVDFALPSDELVQGTALIASTAVGESAQESAAIGGSFFTHHLEVALRGAGDQDGDGKVTLAEAFRYTAARTLAGTASTQAGPQHPTYDFKMSGRGDIVLADLRRAEASLRIPPDKDGSYVIHGKQQLLAEIAGSPTGTMLALPSGRYTVERRAPDGLATTTFDLATGETRSLPAMRPTAYELARAKGGPAPTLWFAGGGVGFYPLPGLGASPLLQIGARQEVGPFGLRLRITGMQRDANDAALHYSFLYLGGAGALLTPFPLGPVLLEVGPEAGLGYVSQKLNSGASASAPDLGASGVAMATFRTGPFRMGLDVSAGAHLFKLDGQATIRPSATFGLLFLYGL
ncbi:MAG TPA: caspase family protein [Myxococcales bacterium]|nr:caspase family protein [Myxococcales bacterium]